MLVPTITIVETSMPTDGSAGSAKIKISGADVSVTTSIFLSPDDNDMIEQAIWKWRRAVEPVTESPEYCDGSKP